jgi:hypothetical protein
MRNICFRPRLRNAYRVYCLVCFAAGLVFLAAPAHAANPPGATDAKTTRQASKPAAMTTPAPASLKSPAIRPYVSVKPAAGPYRLYVLGDSLADGAWSGLVQRFKASSCVKIFRKSRVNTGIVRADRFHWPRGMAKIARASLFQIAVLMFGANDLQSIREKGRWHHFKTAGWLARFNRRIDGLIAPLLKRKIAVYWLGIPVVRKKAFRRDYAYVNALFRDKMKQHGVKFIDTWQTFASASGAYTAFGRDLAGRKTLLRHSDGVHFTASGYAKLASLVENEIRKDIGCPRAKPKSKQAAARN